MFEYRMSGVYIRFSRRAPRHRLTRECSIRISDSAITRDQRRVYRCHCRRFLLINPLPTRDFQVVDGAGSGFGLGSRLCAQ